MTQAIDPIEQNVEIDPELGPITDKDSSKAEISFSDKAVAPKLTNIDENRLNKQINCFKKQDVKSDHRNPSKNSNLLNKSKNVEDIEQKVSENQDRNSELHDQSFDKSTGKAEYQEKQVIASNSNYTKPESKTEKKPIIYKSSIKEIKRREFEEMSNTDEIARHLQEDLQVPLIPISRIPAKRRKLAENEEDNILLNIRKARKSRNKEINKLLKAQEGEESESSSSSVSDDSVSSTERDDLIRKYFKKILCPILQEEREQSKKETIEMLEGTGLMELSRKRKLINLDNTKKVDPNKDPFLEDEGFLPSDVSGMTTPRKSVSNVHNVKGTERKDSFKMVKTSQSQENKITGTPKRSKNYYELQKQIILPDGAVQNNLKVKQNIRHDSTNEYFNDADEIRSQSSVSETKEHQKKSIPPLFTHQKDNLNIITQDNKSKINSVEIRQHKEKAPECEENIQKKSLNEKVVEEESKEELQDNIVDKPKCNVEINNGATESYSFPKIQKQDIPTVENNDINKIPQEGQIKSIFSQKNKTTNESLAGVKDVVQSKDSEESKPKASIFGNIQSSILQSNTKLNPIAQSVQPKVASSNPFLGGNATRPLNLFSQVARTQSNPHSFAISDKTTVTARTSIFGPPSGSVLIKKDIPSSTIQNISSSIPESKHIEEDVGMSDVTPPSHSPIITPAPRTLQSKPGSNIFPFITQGSGESKPRVQVTSTLSIFTNQMNRPKQEIEPKVTNLYSSGTKQIFKDFVFPYTFYYYSFKYLFTV